jgi:hypothetical protein
MFVFCHEKYFRSTFLHYKELLEVSTRNVFMVKRNWEIFVEKREECQFSTITGTSLNICLPSEVGYLFNFPKEKYIGWHMQK